MIDKSVKLDNFDTNVKDGSRGAAGVRPTRRRLAGHEANKVDHLGRGQTGCAVRCRVLGWKIHEDLRLPENSDRRLISLHQGVRLMAERP